MKLDPKTPSKEVFGRLETHSTESVGKSFTEFWSKPLAGPGTVGAHITAVACASAAGLIVSDVNSLFHRSKKESA
jgi:hypothetical protein